LLDELIAERKRQAISYQEYLEKVKELANKVTNPNGTKNEAGNNIPESIDTLAKRALYDNLGSDELLAVKIDAAIRYTKKAEWIGDRMKEKEVARAIHEESTGYDVNVQDVLEIAKRQKEYQ